MIHATQRAVPAVLACLTAAAAAAQSELPREVRVAAIPGVVAAGAEWQLVWHGIDNADGIVGTPDGGVLFAQEQPNRIGKLDAAGGFSVFLEGTRGAGSLSLDADGNLFAVERTCTDPGRRTGTQCAQPTAVAVIHPARRVLADSFAGRPLGRLNDLVADGRGGAYFTVGDAYHVDAEGRVTRLSSDLRTNGVALSPGKETVYVTDRETIVAFDVGPGGAASNRRELARLEAGGVGDGMAVDDEGRLYVTSGPGVQVLAATGEYLGVIPTPRSAISAAFSGPGMQTLYIVGSGAALGPNGTEFTTPEGVRNNAKTIYAIQTIAAGISP